MIASDRPISVPSETGLKPMKDLQIALEHTERPPPLEVLAKSFHDFFRARSENPAVMTDFQARLLLGTWKHLETEQYHLDPTSRQNIFSLDAIENTLVILSEVEAPREARHAILKLARSVYWRLMNNMGADMQDINRAAGIAAFVNLLATHGEPLEAELCILEFWNRLREWKPSPWLPIVRALAVQGDPTHLRRFIAELEDHGVPFDPAFQEEVIRLLIEQDEFNAVKLMYKCTISSGEPPSASARRALIRYAILKGEINWAAPIYESLPPFDIRENLEVTLLWEAAHGNGAYAALENVQASTADPEWRSSLTISCVNNLIQYANSIGNPKLSAGYAELAATLGLEPDAQTRLLQLEFQVMTKDISGMTETIGYLHHFGTAAFQNMPLVNRLIQVLCQFAHDSSIYELVSIFLDPLFENNVHLSPETIASLTRMLLRRGDVEAASDLLRPRLSSFGEGGRMMIQDVFSQVILQRVHDVEQTWQIYGLLKLAIPETDIARRTEIMNLFFDRDQSDYACQVFGHMRQASNPVDRPTAITYAECFQGIAQAGDDENLKLVHNMLKLDVLVDLNLHVLNGLMLAYANCGKPNTSMDLFRQILASDEGPSITTLRIFFRACEDHFDGGDEAVRMMKKLKGLEMQAYRDLYTSYIAALGAQCKFTLGRETIDNMERETGHPPTKET